MCTTQSHTIWSLERDMLYDVMYSTESNTLNAITQHNMILYLIMFDCIIEYWIPRYRHWSFIQFYRLTTMIITSICVLSLLQTAISSSALPNTQKLYTCRTLPDRSFQNSATINLPEPHWGFDVQQVENEIRLAAALKSHSLVLFRLELSTAEVVELSRVKL